MDRSASAGLSPLPQITREDRQGTAKYRDTEESDVFILSGAEDLVPVLVRQDDSGHARTCRRGR